MYIYTTMPTNYSYFIAIILPDPLHSEIESIKKNISKEYGTKSVLRSPAHITIVPPFFWGNETELLETLNQFTFPEFDIQLKNYHRFLERVIFIDVVENKNLLELHQQFSAHFFSKYPGINKRHPYPFHPHITIGNRDWKPEQFNRCWEEFKGKEFSANFGFKKLTLLKNVENKWKNVL
jgi:2'-5' RNA ligase